MIPAAEIRQLLPKAAEITAGLNHAQLNWRPAAGGWSIAECLAHLNVTDELYCAKIAEAIPRARMERVFGTGPFRLGWLESRFAQFMEPPYRMKLKAPKEFRPAAEHAIDQVLDEWRCTRLRFLELANEAEGLHLSKVRVPSPTSTVVSVSLLGAFAIAVAHDRRHLWQAERIRCLLRREGA